MKNMWTTVELNKIEPFRYYSIKKRTQNFSWKKGLICPDIAEDTANICMTSIWTA